MYLIQYPEIKSLTIEKLLYVNRKKSYDPAIIYN